MVKSNSYNTVKGNTLNETGMDAVTCHPGPLLGMKGLFAQPLETLLMAPSHQPFLDQLWLNRATWPEAVPLLRQPAFTTGRVRGIEARPPPHYAELSSWATPRSEARLTEVRARLCFPPSLPVV